jgi:hypothetical protein
LSHHSVFSAEYIHAELLPKSMKLNFYWLGPHQEYGIEIRGLCIWCQIPFSFMFLIYS